MASPSSDRTEPKSQAAVHQVILSQFQGDWVERLNIEQLFILIDGVLPFEACLYYQVLPLFLEGSRLNLGMVSPDDAAALDYVRRIISYLNYSLMPRPMSSEALQAALSAYLHHAGSQRNGAQKLSAPNRPNRGSARARASQQIDRNAQQTLIVDSPDQITLAGQQEAPTQEVSAPPPQIPFSPVTPPQEAAIAAEPEAGAIDANDLPGPVVLDPVVLDPVVLDSAVPDLLVIEEVHPADSPPPPAVPPSMLVHALPALEVQANYLSSPVEVLATLSPKELLQELLGRVLIGGIGRLYFERQAEYGRILWSQNGVLQSVLDQLEPVKFQGVINELKHLAQLPMIPVQKPRQVEIERLYQNTRLLLRFRVMLTGNGEEEATLQVLRGAALRFYQQQQLANLERDALSIAKQLQLKVNEIRDRTRTEAGVPKAKLDALPALNQMLRYIEEQLETLQDETE